MQISSFSRCLGTLLPGAMHNFKLLSFFCVDARIGISLHTNQLHTLGLFQDIVKERSMKTKRYKRKKEWTINFFINFEPEIKKIILIQHESLKISNSMFNGKKSRAKNAEN